MAAQVTSWIERAAEHVFALPPKDVGAELALANVKYGLAKMHYVQSRMGLKADATFLASPDVTVTMNAQRWHSGFAYGGKLTWGEGDRDLVFLDTKPDCCGMLVGGLTDLPSKACVLERAVRMKDDRSVVDGIEIKWNLEKGNHFVDVFELRPLTPDRRWPPYAFIVHTSGSELKRESHLGPGLYADSSRTLAQWAEVVETPFGGMRVLTGDKAREYYQFCRIATRFAQQRRLRAAELLFDDFLPIANAIHQGLVSQNEIALGVNTWTDDEAAAGDAVFPLALQPDLPSYLMQPTLNLTPKRLDELGWTRRSASLGVYGRLRTANVLPHGAGYDFPQLAALIDVHEIHGQLVFEVKSRRGSGVELLSEFDHVPYEYRGREVLEETIDLGLGVPVAELIPQFVFKI
jgi:hypothetical protein